LGQECERHVKEQIIDAVINTWVRYGHQGKLWQNLNVCTYILPDSQHKRILFCKYDISFRTLSISQTIV